MDYATIGHGTNAGLHSPASIPQLRTSLPASYCGVAVIVGFAYSEIAQVTALIAGDYQT